MQNKQLLLGTFLNIKEEENEDYKEKINNFINKLVNDYNILKEKIFIIKNLDNNKQYIITYIFELTVDEHVDFNDIYPGTIPLQKHKETNTIFTINALNSLIEKESNLTKGNIDYKSVDIEWDKYKNTCVVHKNGELIISKTRRIFLK